MTETGQSSTTVVIDALTASADLSEFERIGNTKHGRVVMIGYRHEPFYPHLSGVELHFQLPDGRVALTSPTIEGFDLIWRDTRTPAVLDLHAGDVVNSLWDQLNTAFQEVLAPTLFDAATKAVVTALGGPDRWLTSDPTRSPESRSADTRS